MRYSTIGVALSILLSGCKPDKAKPDSGSHKPESQASTPAPAPPSPPKVNVVTANEPPVAQPMPKVDPAEDENRKLNAYIREERIRQIEAAKSRVESLMRSIEPDRVETDQEVIRALGVDPLNLVSPDWPARAQAYRDLKAKARERQNRALEDAQAHLRSLLLGSDEKTIAIPVR